MSDKLKFEIAIDRPDLVGSSISVLLNNWSQEIDVREILVAEIDPVAAGGYDFCKKYGISFNEGANCVIVEAIRGEKRSYAACLALVGYSLDLNKVVRKTLNARRVSLASLPYVLEQTQMEYGSITAFGLPSDWPILIDSRIAHSQRIVIGSGILKSKLSLPSLALINLPGAIVIEDLAYETR